jgi:hypothetical protein
MTDQTASNPEIKIENSEIKPKKQKKQRTYDHPNSLANLAIGTKNSKDEASERKALFIQALSTLWPQVSLSAKQANISRQQAYQWRLNDEAFAQQWEDIEEIALDKLENRIIEACHQAGGAGYGFGVLKAYRKKYTDKLEHSGQISNFTIQSNVRISDTTVDKAGALVETDKSKHGND